jgi:hypothetical protein
LSQFWASGTHNVAVKQYMNPIGMEFTEQTIVVSYSQNSQIALARHFLDPSGYIAQSINIKSRIDLVKYGKPRG